MNPGDLNKRIKIQMRNPASDDYGQPVNEWIPEFEVWANIRPVGGNERLIAMSLQTMQTHTVAVRYQPGMMPPKNLNALRILYETPECERIFNIIGARDLDEKHQFVVFDCVEGSENGD